MVENKLPWAEECNGPGECRKIQRILPAFTHFEGQDAREFFPGPVSQHTLNELTQVGQRTLIGGVTPNPNSLETQGGSR